MSFLAPSSYNVIPSKEGIQGYKVLTSSWGSCSKEKTLDTQSTRYTHGAGSSRLRGNDFVEIFFKQTQN